VEISELQETFGQEQIEFPHTAIHASWNRMSSCNLIKSKLVF